MTQFSLTMYSYAKPRGETVAIEARSGTEAGHLRDQELRRRAHVIKGQARRVVGWSPEDAKRKRAEILNQIAWLHGTVERIGPCTD